MKQKIKQFEGSIIQKNNDYIMVEEVYLQIIYLKSTFDILLSHKINLHEKWIRKFMSVYLKHYTCKMSFDHCYKIV
jgi:hypothetical protein